MNPQAIAENVCNLHRLVAEAYTREYGAAPSKEEMEYLFTRAHHEYISHFINDSKKGRSTRPTPQRRQPPQQQQSPHQATQANCEVCGRPLTNKEKNWCDQHGTNYVCYHCTQQRQGQF